MVCVQKILGQGSPVLSVRPLFERCDALDMDGVEEYTPRAPKALGGGFRALN